MELSQLSEKQRISIITDINNLLSEKYNISDRNIKNFWMAFEVGVNEITEYQKQQCQQKIDIAYL